MSTEESKVVMRRFEEQMNAHDVDGVLALVTADFIDHSLPAGVTQTLESARQFLKAQFAAFPDVRGTLVDIFAEGDCVATRVDIEGTHLGPLMGIPPTGRRVKWTDISLGRAVDGKIAERWSVIDLMGLMQQLGVVPPPRPA